MNKELQSFKDNNVWKLVDRTPEMKPINTKWVFKIKTDSKSYVNTFKARLVAKGYTQQYNIDYKELSLL